ncbi:hypothetical protein LIER_39503 [Lithospermum erythrorhizon]|uniref:Bet v I/Major latex protein domain-containing protein n=1 Tax=Lithospermum erythrorhizon TaxID=34254 RepID=A0AAV3QJ18_LITER
MAITTFTEEHTSPISASRIFMASIIDSHNLIPELMPHLIESIEFLQGDGGPGTIKKINYAEGNNFKSVKHRIDELSLETLTYKYTLIEADTLVENLQNVTYEIKLEKLPNGGTNSKVTTKYYTNDDIILKEEQIRAGKERVYWIFKAVEAYLILNPEAYACSDEEKGEIMKASFKPLKMKNAMYYYVNLPYNKLFLD